MYDFVCVSVFLRVSLVWGVKLYACVGAELIFMSTLSRLVGSCHDTIRKSS